jgi:hypothetical protein
MKHILLTILTASLMIACDKTDNELEIYNAFFGASDQPSALTDYEGVTTTHIYSPDFNNTGGTDVVNWYSEGDGTATVSSGILHIEAANNNPAGIWFDFSPVSKAKNFQVEMSLKSDNFPTNSEQGLIFDINSSSKQFGYFAYSTATYPFLIGRLTGNNQTDWFQGSTPINYSNYHLFTIRKLGSRLVFFLDKQFLYAATTSDFSTAGFYVGKKGTMLVEYVTVDEIQ